ncbi:zinc-binding dehydrogenase [Streptomyces hirsutus]|uniref:zinc-binding dehydrogenase n=1 Tax=Streptomyces hirsutus TaxID=35620 RepID=UPI0033E690B9
MGSAAVMAAKVAGCTTVVAVDPHDSRLEPARRIGATHTVNSGSTDVVSELKKITGGKGVGFVVDTTAVPGLPTQALDALAIRGTIVLVGAAAAGTTVPFEIGESLLKGWTFKTVIEGSSVPQVFIPHLVELWQQGRFPFDELVSAYEFEAINEAFADSADGTTIKPVVVF